MKTYTDKVLRKLTTQALIPPTFGAKSLAERLLEDSLGLLQIEEEGKTEPCTHNLLPLYLQWEGHSVRGSSQAVCIYHFSVHRFTNNLPMETTLSKFLFSILS